MGDVPRLECVRQIYGCVGEHQPISVSGKNGTPRNASAARKFADASGKFSAVFYKEEIESAFRTPGLAGYSLLGINDFPGQHLSVIGMLDEFWDDKGIITPEFHSMYSRAVVPLRVWNVVCGSGRDILRADVEIATTVPMLSAERFVGSSPTNGGVRSVKVRFPNG